LRKPVQIPSMVLQWTSRMPSPSSSRAHSFWGKPRELWINMPRIGYPTDPCQYWERGHLDRVPVYPFKLDRFIPFVYTTTRPGNHVIKTRDYSTLKALKGRSTPSNRCNRERTHRLRGPAESWKRMLRRRSPWSFRAESKCQ